MEKSPEESASLPSRLFFCWLNKLIGIGAAKPLEQNDLYPLLEAGTSAKLAQDFERERRKEQGKKSIVWPFVRSQKWTIIKVTSARVVADCIQYLNPMLLKLFIEFSASEYPMGYCFGIVLAMFLMAQTRSILQNFQVAGMFRMAAYYHNTLSNAIMRKILSLSTEARSTKTVGELLNHAAIDVEVIVSSIPYLQNTWSVPFQIILALIMLWIILGPSALAGVAIMVLFIPMNFFTSRRIKMAQARQMKVKDERVKLTNELLNGIKIIKLYAWEPSFEQKVNALRREEVDLMRKVCFLSRFVDVANSASPFLVAIGTFTCFVLTHPANSLTPARAFVALTVFNILRTPMRMVANVINTLVQAVVSNSRLRRFLNEDDVDSEVVVHGDGIGIQMKDATLAWERKGGKAVVKNINLSVEEGSLVAIVGPVGSGKSSILAAVLGDLHIEGRVSVQGTLGLVAQQTWLMNTTIKENILFGEVDYDEQRYQKVVDVCQLRDDFATLDQGDQTVVGDNGMKLSGGQRARVTLARAVFKEKDIYLLDDPLAAVDAQVGRRIFDQVINGILSQKTRLLVTHNLSYTKEADKIIVVEDGSITEQGDFNTLKSSKGPFSKLLEQFEQDERSQEETQSEEVEMKKKNKKNESRKDEKKTKKEKKQEMVQLGTVNWKVYRLYFQSLGYFNSIGFFTCIILYHVVLALRSYWLTAWSDANISPVANNTISTNERLYVYAAYGIFEIKMLAIAFVLLTVGTLRASYGLHLPLLASILRAPMRFFDETPSGQVLNRLSKDLDMVEKLQDSLRQLSQSFLYLLTIVIIVSITTPIFLMFVIPLGYVYYKIMTYFIPTARQLKRIESTKRSPILTMIKETIQGTTTIKAFGKVHQTITKFMATCEGFTQCRYLNSMSNRWLAVRLEALGNIMVLLVGFSATLSTRFFGATPGMTGLSVSYALSITEALAMLVRMFSEMESNIVSIERIKELQEIEQEAPWETEKMDENWPKSGKIEFNSYSTRYSKDLPLVLKEIQIQIEDGERVGVIGRTGSGKSTLASAIFRLLEASEGSLMIGDVDICKLGLHQLRRAIVVLPQEPIVFSGTLRFNLDPFGLHSDVELWQALDACQMRTFAQKDVKALDLVVKEGGRNLSMGQRQLLCLCRAILRKAKIVILDEATANVDALTDSVVQKAIRENFPSSTILAIAHRLETIAEMDRIMVLENGDVAEFDTPGNLLKDPNSLYFQLLQSEKNNS